MHFSKRERERERERENKNPKEMWKRKGLKKYVYMKGKTDEQCTQKKGVGMKIN